MKKILAAIFCALAVFTLACCTSENDNKDVKLNISILDNTDLFQKLKKDELDLVISRYPLFYRFEKNIVIRE